MNKHDRIVGLTTILLIVGGLFFVSNYFATEFSGSMQTLVLPEPDLRHPEIEMRSSLLQQISASAPSPSMQLQVGSRRF